MVGSVLQPIVGFYTDKHPKPFSLVFGMGVTLCGLVLLALAPTYAVVLLAAGCVGLGSAIFHPESSRMARLASGGRHGFAQSLFQVGGNAGTALGPLLAAGIIVLGHLGDDLLTNDLNGAQNVLLSLHHEANQYM